MKHIYFTTNTHAHSVIFSEAVLISRGGGSQVIMMLKVLPL